MKRIALLYLFLCIGFAAIAQSPGYILVMHEEFNGSSLNTEDFKSGLPWTAPYISKNINREYHAPENLIFTGNDMNIKSSQLNSPVTINGADFDFKSGAITGKRRYKYGVYEVGVVLPFGDGQWPSFWLWGNNPHNHWITNEIDVFEIRGGHDGQVGTNYPCQEWDPVANERVNISGTFQVQNNDANGNPIGPYLGRSTTASLSWSEDNESFVYGLDGKHIRTASYGIETSMWPIVSLQVGDKRCPTECYWGTNPSGNHYMKLEYMKIWKWMHCGEDRTHRNWRYETDPSYITGGQVTMAGNGGYSPVEDEQYLTVYYENVTTLKPGFHAKRGSVTHIQNQAGSCVGVTRSAKVPGTIQAPATAMELEKSATVFPNPSGTGQFNLRTEGFADNKQVRVFSIYGNLITEFTTAEELSTIDLSSYAKGMYIVKVSDATGEKTQKVIFE